MSTEQPQRTPHRQSALTSGVQRLQSMSLSAGSQQQAGVGVVRSDVAARSRVTPAAAIVATSAGTSDASTASKRKFASHPADSCQLQAKRPTRSRSSSASDSSVSVSEDADEEEESNSDTDAGDSEESNADTDDSESTSEEETHRPLAAGGTTGRASSTASAPTPSSGPAIKKKAPTATAASTAPSSSAIYLAAVPTSAGKNFLSDVAKEENDSDEDEDELFQAASAKVITSPAGIPKSSTIKLRYLADFLSAAECAHLIAVSESTGFAPSVVGALDDSPDYVSSVRTSFSGDVPSSDPVRQSVVKQVRRLLALSPHSHVQVAVVRYQPGQRYLTHFDSSTADPQRMRQHTVFIYLNDVAGGGETWFPRLHLKVRPKCGAALLWENHADRASKVHRDAEHAGLPPTKGVKVSWRHRAYGAAALTHEIKPADLLLAWSFCFCLILCQYGLNIWVRFPKLTSLAAADRASSDSDESE